MGGQMITEKIKRRFWSKTRKRRNGCIDWIAAKISDGYGQFKLFSYVRIYSHRLSWILANGEIPDGLQVLHKCDNPACVNPEHLFLGTNQDNIDDKVSKGRQSRLIGKQHGMFGKGYLVSKEKHNFSKLTELKVIEIRKLYASGHYTQNTLAKQFNITMIQMDRIINRKQWSN
jgi:hypothetical protein